MEITERTVSGEVSIKVKGPTPSSTTITVTTSAELGIDSLWDMLVDYLCTYEGPNYGMQRRAVEAKCARKGGKDYIDSILLENGISRRGIYE